MSNSIRRTLIIATGLAAFGAGSMASAAGINEKLVERVRERAESQQQSQPQQQAPRQQAPQQQAPQQQAPQAQRAPAGRESRPNFRNNPERARSESPRVAGAAPAPRPQAPAPAQQGNRGNGPDRDRDRGNARGNNDLGIVGGALARGVQEANRGNDRGNGRGNSRGDRDDRNGNWRGEHRSPRVVQRLPYGYRNYNWNGRPYYTYGGRWYQPYGSSYIAIGAPYGLFVSSLPGYSSSFYYGNSRYYYYDDTYYMYEPARRGYVVTRSPYNDDVDDDYYYDDALDEDMYVYPSRGQSEQQQADDRYECHRWAVSETDYDPIDDDYDRDLRAEYVRAMTACLTGRGYSVR
jgi:hypothetical protein